MRTLKLVLSLTLGLTPIIMCVYCEHAVQDHWEFDRWLGDCMGISLILAIGFVSLWTFVDILRDNDKRQEGVIMTEIEQTPTWKLKALAELNPELVYFSEVSQHLNWSDTKHLVKERELDCLMRVVCEKMSNSRKEYFIARLGKIIGNWNISISDHGDEGLPRAAIDIFDITNATWQQRLDAYLMAHGITEPKESQ